MTVHDQHEVTSTEWRTLPNADGPMNAFVARPRAPRAGLVVLQEAFGINEHIQDVTRRAAQAGYLAVAPDLFHRHDEGPVSYSDRDTAMSRIAELGVDRIDTDVRAVIDHLAEHEDLPASRVGIVGFCFGGRAAFTAATLVPGLAATTVFYGPGIAAGPHAVLDRVSSIDGPVLMIVGDDDPTIPPEHLDSIRTACAEAGVDLRIEVFPGAGHAFHCDARPQAYHPDAAPRAWEMTLQFFADAIPTSAS
jgi:carboxymethylenebutenolidase